MAYLRLCRSAGSPTRTTITPTEYMQALTLGTGYPGSWVIPAAADNIQLLRYRTQSRQPRLLPSHEFRL
jgi:hypothetical protein